MKTKLNRLTVKLFFLFAILVQVIFVTHLCANDFYWEKPASITETDARFPKVASSGSETYIFWQTVDKRKKTISLSGRYCGCSSDDKSSKPYSWNDLGVIAGPFDYSGEIPDIFSTVVTSEGIVSVAAVTGTASISVFTSFDHGKSFIRKDFKSTSESSVAPRLFCTSTGKLILFSSSEKENSFSLLYAYSSDGRTWSDFKNFEPSESLQNPFLPYLSSTVNGDIVVFQSQYIKGSKITYQLYTTESRDDCMTWSTPVLVTGQNSLPSDSSRDFSLYNNQRPDLYYFNGHLYLAWERTLYTSENSEIWVAPLTTDGISSGAAEQITSSGKANRPILFSYNNILSLVWFDTRRGIETVYLSQKNSYLWNETTLSSGWNSATFAYPVITDSGKILSFIWESVSLKNKSEQNIYILEPDVSVKKPSIKALSYKEGGRYTSEKAKMQIALPSDSSGIAGFSWIWTKNKDENPPKEFMRLPSQNTISVDALSDGYWYLKVRVADYAGNWSDSVQISYYRDTTPPLKPILNLPQKDQFGFCSTNSPEFSWTADSRDVDIAGYTWALEYRDVIDTQVTERKNHPMKLPDEDVKKYVADYLDSHKTAVETAQKPPASIRSKSPEAEYYNRSNGFYTFSVAAVDTAGNIGEPQVITLLLNKYIPSTYIVSLSTKKDILGDVALTIYGNGFTYDGTVSEIYLDRDGKTPYDVTLKRSDDDYQITSDQRITGIKLPFDIASGVYKIGLLHTDRGLYMSRPLLTLTENGTVKIQKQYDFEPSWIPAQNNRKIHIEMGTLLLWILCILSFLGVFITINGLVSTVKEASLINREAKALLTGDSMPYEKKKRTRALKKKGISLKIKLMTFTSFLVLFIVLLVSIPLRFMMTKTQEQTLAEGLEQRVEVLMESLSSGVSAYMPSKNLLELSYLPAQSSALKEAEYATVLGLPSDGNNTNLDYVWATNDNNIMQKIDSDTLTYGVSRITDTVISGINEKSKTINKTAQEQVDEIAANISQLNTEGIDLALKTDKASVKRREEIATVTTELNARLKTELETIASAGTGSYPTYNTEKLDRKNTSYLFYKPVLYRQGSEKNYVRGIVTVEISTAELIKSVDASSRKIFYTVLAIALIAVMTGAVGAFFLATIIVKPIRQLAAHVAMIGQTVDKEKLAGKDIEITTHDEIGQLGETVNEMTHGLVKAAQDEHLLMDGKVVQQTFLPLIQNRNGSKDTVAEFNDKKVQAFGYYEGASGVSGDYFDYKKLDSRWYVFIKCDASGHGVPAALIMTIVATLFRKYFEKWNYRTNGIDLTTLVVQINDFIESLGIKGKFATIILCLLDSETGDVYLCNAGDNIVHIYDSTEKRQKSITLSETPAAGPLPSFMVDMKGGFKVEKYHINPGDVMFLYTDGIEEATRKFRDSNFQVMKCAEPGFAEGAVHGNHKVGDSSEQLEPERVNAVIEAVFAGKVYRLKKYHNPDPNEVFEFDFSTCKRTIEDAIIGLAAVEKVFRMYKDPKVTQNDTVKVDRRIDAFLKNHFNMYTAYCENRKEDSEDSSYLYYTYLKEDEQLDDLTLVAVSRN